MLVAVVLSGALGLTGCGGAPLASGPPVGGAAAPSGAAGARLQVAALWPDPALTVTTTPKGVREPLGPVDATLQPEVEWFAGEKGISREAAAVELQDQNTFSAWAERAQQLAGDRFSALAWGDPDDDAVPPWVAYTGEQPPEGLVALAEELPFPVELRGGAVMSDAERERVQSAGLDAFEADVVPVGGWGGGLDAPTGRFDISYVPEGARKRADDATTAAVVAAALASLGRDAPISVDLGADDRDPATTEPAVWFLPAGFVPDPSATSVEVLVGEQGCTSGQGASGNTADPAVDVTGSEVRIAVSTYIRKGSQSCPGHPLAPLVVELGQPLGNRTLVDVNGTIDDASAPPESVWGNIQVPIAG